MSDFRFKYGVSYGTVGNFQSRTDNLLASTDTTPDVTDGNLFYTNNASATSITHWDLSGANVVSEHQGKEIRVIYLDASTTLVAGAQLRLKDGQNVPMPALSVTDFIYLNSAWVETYRSYNTASQITVTSANVSAASLITINPAVTSVLLLTGASSSMTLNGMAGGYTGQTVTLHTIGSSVTFITNSAGLTDSFTVTTVAGTSAISTGSKSTVFIRAVVGGTAKWLEANGIV